MPSLRELLDLVRSHAEQHGLALPAVMVEEVEMVIRREWPTQRVYVPPPETRRDPGRVNAIRRAAGTLPTGVVAERYGVSASWVRRVTRKDK